MSRARTSPNLGHVRTGATLEATGGGRTAAGTISVALPDRLHFTDLRRGERADRHDSMALLVGFALDQQVPVPKAFSGAAGAAAAAAAGSTPPPLAANGPRGSAPRQPGDPPLPRRQGGSAACRELTAPVCEVLRQRRRAGCPDRRPRRAGPARDPRGAARLRRDEGHRARLRARQALRGAAAPGELCATHPTLGDVDFRARR